VPPPTIEEAAAREVITADASSDLISQEDAHEVIVKATEEALVHMGEPKPSEPAARASFSP
jgi:hypothetical protein